MWKKCLFLLNICFFLISCSQIQNKATLLEAYEKNSSFILFPFENYTETPLAGLRVSSIAYGVLVSKGYNVIRYEVKEDKDYSPENIKTFLNQAKAMGYKYAIVGMVNEFRYKTGIDGEPAVSITFVIYDLDKEKPIYIATGARSGWAHESIGTTTQKILKEIIP